MRRAISARVCGAALPTSLCPVAVLAGVPVSATLTSLSSSTWGTPSPAVFSARFQSGGADDEEKLLEEVMMLTSSPIPIGTLFKSLSSESRNVLIKKKLPMETYLLRHKDVFSVYKSGDKSPIMASRVTDVPVSAMKGVEASADRIFNGKTMDPNMHAVYTVLKYIPNEWSPYVSLGIPEEVRIKFMNKKPKSFFEGHPKYFEVKAQALRSHTFEVRRSLALQKATEQQQQD